MQANVGGIDRAIAATLKGAIGLWGWLGLLPLATGVFRFCPAYVPFGMRSCAVKK